MPNIWMFSYFITLGGINVLLCFCILLILSAFIDDIRLHTACIVHKKCPVVFHKNCPNADLQTQAMFTHTFPYVHKFEIESSNYFTYLTYFIYTLNILIFICGIFVVVENIEVYCKNSYFILCFLNWVVNFLFLFTLYLLKNTITGTIEFIPDHLDTMV